jgi:acetyltransferase-like isoleucine patch superfamily enzyme
VQRAWQTIIALGTVGPEDARGRCYAGFGDHSAISFPPGSVFGERWIRIGADTLIGPNVSMAAGMADDGALAPAAEVIVIGDRVNIGRGSSIVGMARIEIGDDVTTGPNVYITDHNHTYADRDVPVARQWPSDDPVHIGPGCWLGAGAVVLPGTTLGCNVVVAANAVVRGDIPDYAVVAGSPARIVRQWIEGEGWCPPLRDVTVRPPEGWDTD